MKLYRGIKTMEFTEGSKAIQEAVQSGWSKILKLRSAGNLKYPKQLDSLISELFKLQPLTRQYFTDNKKIAAAYAKKEHGVLIEIDLSIKDILAHFTIEFQNYSKRKSQFEIVYMIKGSDLSKNARKWKLKIS
jgi:hypothetical protein